MTKSILIVEDDLTFATALRTWLTKKGFTVSLASSCAKAREEMTQQRYDIVLSDLRLPDEDGTSLFPWIKKNATGTPIIIMTNYADIQSAVNAMKHGASDYISKPVHPEELLKKIEEAIEPKEISNNTVKQNSTTSLSTNEFIEGCSDAAHRLYKYVALVAPTPMSVLINGASGTGKEFVAKRIHQLSKRSNKPFIAIDCGSIPKELAASEFFGHVKGSFTGAINEKTGAFVEAEGGTLFLDEIGNLSYEVQVQLLRALQERRIRPIGSIKEIEVDVRIICATNENLQEAIERGIFREDLFHRINEFTLNMPSLRERKEDILLFANYFLDLSNKELERNISGFDKEATELLLNYPWPGNLRQLKNVIKRATLLAQEKLITSADLGLAPIGSGIENSANLNIKADEKRRIIEALHVTSNNKSKAAEILGIDRKTLYNKLKLYDIE